MLAGCSGPNMRHVILEVGKLRQENCSLESSEEGRKDGQKEGKREGRKGG